MRLLNCTLLCVLLWQFSAKAQKYSIDFAGLISNYSDVGGQNTNEVNNNVLSYQSYGSLDYRLSFHVNKRNHFFGIEVEASRRTIPTLTLASKQLVMENFGIALMGVGKTFLVDSIRLRVISGFALMHNKITTNVAPNTQTFLFLTPGFSFGGDISFSPHSILKRRQLNGIYLKTGFRGSLETVSISLRKDQPKKPLNGISSLLIGVGINF